MPTRLTHRGYIAILALASAAILALGVRFKPGKLPEPTVSGEEVMRLQTLTQRKNLDNLAVYFSGVADTIQPSLVWLNEMGMTGIVWNPERLIVTAGITGPLSKSITALTVNGNISLESEAISEQSPVSSLQAPSGSLLQPVHRAAAASLTPGVWILQVARQAGGNFLFTPGIYGGIASTHCGAIEYQTVQSSLPLTESALGGGLFDVDGNLLAVVLRCGGGAGNFAAVTLNDVVREIAKANSFEGQLLRTDGFEVAALDDVSRQYFQLKEGVVVREVIDGGPADTAGLYPGDVITALDNSPVRSADDLRPLMAATPKARTHLDVWRNRHTTQVELAAAKETPGATTGTRGVALSDPAQQGFLVGRVSPASPAERASIRPGDRLLLIDGKPPANLAAVRKALSTEKPDPIFVLLQRGSCRIGAFLN